MEGRMFLIPLLGYYVLSSHYFYIYLNRQSSSSIILRNRVSRAEGGFLTRNLLLYLRMYSS